MKRINGIILTMLSAVAFGFMPTLAKIAYNEGFNSYTVVFLRFAITTIVVLLFLKIKKINMKITIKQLIRVMFVSIIGYCITSIMLFMSYDYISIGMATTLHFIYPASVTFLSFILYKEKLTLNKIVSLICCLVGLYILITCSKISVNMFGIVLAVVSGITYSIYMVEAGHSIIKTINTYVLVFYVALFAALSTAIYTLPSGYLHFHSTLLGWSAVLGIALFCTVFALIVLNQGIKYIGASDAAILSTFEPLSSMVLGVIFFGDILTIRSIMGSLCVMLSVIILVIPFHRTKVKKHRNVYKNKITERGSYDTVKR